jgi:alkylation response protein AidB-like acyl-CoA dehydrogenase
MSAAARARGAGLRALTRLAGSEALDRLGVRRGIERSLFHASRGGFRVAVSAGRTFRAARALAAPSRQRGGEGAGMFDLTPDEEQAMLVEAVGAFANERVRPAAGAADDACETPAELLEQASGLGLGTLGIPIELGGAVQERAAVTAVLAAEALAHGDMGIAYAALASGAVASALGLWGDADQQAAYLPPFAEDEPPIAALAMLEPRPLFDPLAQRTRARRDGGDWVITGEKALVAHAEGLELTVVAAELPDGAPGLFLIEAGSGGLYAQPQPAMGLRPARTGRLVLEDVRVPGVALIGDGDPEVYGECVQRARIAWCALACGTARAALDYVIPYVKEREAFGEPICSRQSVAFAVADMAIELEGMRLATWRAASRADKGMAFGREAALSRSLCARHGMRIASDAVQLLGGHGYVKEHPVERWYRDLRAAGVMEGALLV